MTPGEVVLIALPVLGGVSPKLRPALVLALFPGPYQSLLPCGISSQLHLIEANWDEPIQASDPDYAASGLRVPSIIRLSYLQAADPNEVTGVIGAIDPARLNRMLIRLADHLRP